MIISIMASAVAAAVARPVATPVLWNMPISVTCWSAFSNCTVSTSITPNWVFVFKRRISPIVPLVSLTKKNSSRTSAVDTERSVISALSIHSTIVCLARLERARRWTVRLENDISKASWLTPKLNSAFREAFDKLLQSVSDQNTTLKNAPSYVSLCFHHRIISFSLFFLLVFSRRFSRSVKAHWSIGNACVRSIGMIKTNNERCVRSSMVEWSRSKSRTEVSRWRLTFTLSFSLPLFSYGPLEKPLIQYPNGNSLKYPYHIQFQPQIFTSHNLFHRSQTQRRNHQRWRSVCRPWDRRRTFFWLFIVDLSMMIIEMLKNKAVARNDLTI